MKTNIETHLTISKSYDGDWIFYLLPSIWLDYEKNNYFHGKQFLIVIGFLFWDIEIDFNEY